VSAGSIASRSQVESAASARVPHRVEDVAGRFIKLAPQVASPCQVKPRVVGRQCAGTDILSFTRTRAVLKMACRKNRRIDDRCGTARADSRTCERHRYAPVCTPASYAWRTVRTVAHRDEPLKVNAISCRPTRTSARRRDGVDVRNKRLPQIELVLVPPA